MESDFKKHLINLSKDQKKGRLKKIYNELFDNYFIKAKKIEQVTQALKLRRDRNTRGTIVR